MSRWHRAKKVRFGLLVTIIGHIQSLPLKMDRRKAKLLSLLDPTQGQVARYFSPGQVGRLASVEDGFQYVGSQKRTLQNLAYVPFVKASPPRN